MATAIANAEARAEVHRLADEQAALRRVAVLVAEQPSPSEVFTAVTQAVGLLLDADLAVIARLPRRRHGDDDRQLERRRPELADRDTVSTGWRQSRRPHLRERCASANVRLRRSVGAGGHGSRTEFALALGRRGADPRRGEALGRVDGRDSRRRPLGRERRDPHRRLHRAGRDSHRERPVARGACRARRRAGGAAAGRDAGRAWSATGRGLLGCERRGRSSLRHRARRRREVRARRTGARCRGRRSDARAVGTCSTSCPRPRCFAPGRPARADAPRWESADGRDRRAPPKPRRRFDRREPHRRRGRALGRRDRGRHRQAPTSGHRGTPEEVHRDRRNRDRQRRVSRGASRAHRGASSAAARGDVGGTRYIASRSLRGRRRGGRHPVTRRKRHDGSLRSGRQRDHGGIVEHSRGCLSHRRAVADRGLERRVDSASDGAGRLASTTSQLPPTRSASPRGRRASSRRLEARSSSRAISGAS